MPRYFISAGCSFSDTRNTEFSMWNDFVAEYLDAELISMGIGGTGNQFIAHSFMNAIHQKLNEGVPSENISGIVQWSLIHRFAFISSNEQIPNNPNFHAGNRVIYPRSLTNYDLISEENTGWVSVAPWQTNQDTAIENPELHDLSTLYYTNIQNKYTDVLNTLSLYSLVKSFCDAHNIKVMFMWMDENHRQEVLNPSNTWLYSHLSNHIEDSIDLPGMRQQVIKYQKFAEEVWCEDDYQGHPNQVGHKMYFQEHIKPRLDDV